MIYDDELDPDAPHTEITLSNGKLLMIFLGAAVICGACFAFGYSLGKHSAGVATAAATPDMTVPAPQTIVSTGTKPSAGSSGRNMSAPAPEPAPVSVENDRAVPPPAEQTREAAPVAAKAPAAPPIVRAASVKVEAAPAVPAPPVVAPGPHTFMVQVAAVSHKGDADILVSALHRKGYQVNENTANDNLIHVQVGPFATQKDAAAMRDRLSDDGYLAIIKAPTP